MSSERLSIIHYPKFKQPDVKTQVLGIGNSILSDDGVGIHVVECLKAEEIPPGVVLSVGGTGGSALIDMIEESDRLIIVDAIVTGSPEG